MSASFAFDTRAAGALKAGEWLVIKGAPGLRLEANKSRKTWTYRYRSKETGALKQIKIGTYPAMSLAAAMGHWEKLRASREGGTDPALEKRPALKQKDNYTIKHLCDDYLGGYIEKHRVPSGAKDIAYMYASLPAELRSIRAVDLTKRQAVDFIESRMHAPTQADRIRQYLAAAWEYARDRSRIPEETPNYWQRILRQGRPLRTKGRIVGGKHIGTAKRTLKDEEIGVFIRWLQNFSDKTADILTLYLWTGCRGSEICAMNKRDITVMTTTGRLWWIIPKDQTKNRHRKNASDHWVPLIGRAAEIVRRRMGEAGESGYLFPGAQQRADTHYEQKSIGAEMRLRQPYCESRPEWERPRLPATFQHIAPHDLRRTTRTVLASLGCPMEIAEAILGHMPPGIVGVYNLYDYNPQKVMELTKLDAFYEKLAQGIDPAKAVDFAHAAVKPRKGARQIA